MSSRVDVKIGFNCNNRCSFCVQGEKRFSLPAKSKKVVMKELQSGISRGADSVVFTGGEPTINKDLLFFVSFAKSLSYKTIQIQSNGRMFSYEEYCKKLIKHGANQFSPALHGSKSDIHDELVGVKGAFNQVVSGIKNLKKLKQEVIVNVVVNKKNYKDLPKIAKLLVDLKVDQFQFAFIHIVGTAWENRKDIVPEVKKAMPYIKKGLDIAIKNNTRVMTEAVPYCLMPGYENYIAEKIIPESAVFDAGFVIDDYTKYRLERGKSKRKECELCKYYSICEGPWREYPEMFGWDEFVPVIEKKEENLERRYNYYKNFLVTQKENYNNFFLADLLVLIENNKKISAEEIRENWKTFFKDNQKEHVLNFYVHVPFCDSRCSYCMYYSRKASEKNINSYIKNLESQIDYFKDVFKGKTFSSLYFGGGTPSILNEKQLEKILNKLFKSFLFVGGERTFESNPKSTTLSKLKLIKRYGFNRISFGVQNFDKNVLKLANREKQGLDLIKKVIKMAKSLDFEVNTDLMIGLVGDSNEKILNSFEILSALKPDTIALYPLKPSKLYLEKFYNNDNVRFLKDLNKKAGTVRGEIIKNKHKFGYLTKNTNNEIFTSAEPTFYIKNFKEKYTSSYDYTSPLNYEKPCSLFALGTSASSYIFKNMQYHITSDTNDQKIFDAEEKNYWSMDFDERREKIYFILQTLANRKSITFKEYERYFGSKLGDDFKKEISDLKSLGKVRENKKELIFPIDPLERHVSSLFLFDEKKLMKRIVENNAK